MAKRKKRSSSRSKSEDDKSPALAEGLVSEIIAVGLIALGLVVVVGLITDGNGASVVADFFAGLSGRGVFFVPALLLLVSLGIFRSESHRLSSLSVAGMFMTLVAIAGLFHIGAVGDGSWDIAAKGEGGGLLGHVLASVVIGLLGTLAGTIIMSALLLICLMLALNVRLTQLISALAALFGRRTQTEGGETAAGVMQPVSGPEPTLKTNVPLEKPSGSPDAAQPAPVEATDAVLTTSADTDWNFPSLELLDNSVDKADAGDWKRNADIIRETLADFKIEVKMGDINVGPRVTQYTLIPPAGVRLTKITSLDDNIALNLAAPSVRIEAPIPGKRAVGIEVPNRKAAIIRMRMLFETEAWQRHKGALAFSVGQDIGGETVVADLGKMPHLLIAGATNSGKSVMINALLTSLLYRNSPADLKLIMVDPKQVELGLYNDIPHLLTPVITAPEKCISALKWAVAEMERRYSVLAENSKRNIHEYNSLKKEESMPYIVIVIDELADLMMMAARDVESLVVRLAQKARATGIHLVLATQRPSVNVITGLIKANMPTRIAFTVASQVDSRTILDGAGAEKLLGNGDMLFMTPGFAKPRRLQGPLIEEKEVKQVTDHLRMERSPDYNDDVISQPVTISARGVATVLPDIESDDGVYKAAVQVVIESSKASTSYLQRRLGIGYNRAARLIDQMEEQGIVGPGHGAKPREVLVSSADDVLGDDDRSI
jgi:S-DNA-T family DNA segregation ATPase FtsK/SpoIIIE